MRPAGPLVVDLGEDGADEAQERLGVGEERGDARAPLDFLIKGFEGVRGAEPPSVVAWKREDGERFGDVRLDPRSKLGRGRLVLLGDDFDPPVRLGAIGRIEDGPQIARDLGSHRELGYVRECVADEMKLAALPRRAGEDGFTELARDSQDGPLANVINVINNVIKDTHLQNACPSRPRVWMSHWEPARREWPGRRSKSLFDGECP